MMSKIKYGIILSGIFYLSVLFSQDTTQFVKIAKFKTEEARQGIAVDEQFFYAIDSRKIAKYHKKTGQLIEYWEEQENGPIIHLDSGVIVNGKLVCAHSNYPNIPMTSSVEIWDAETLEHIETHSFGIRWGSCTWIDRHDDHWWGAFAHYNKFQDQIGTTNAYTVLVKFDDGWNELESWIYPVEVLERFEGMSNSGGSWGLDGRLYLTGHDRGEIYAMSLPEAGSQLILEEIIPIDIEGQGIAWDKGRQNILYAIHRSKNEVFMFHMIK